jgi:hypothetical protein
VAIYVSMTVAARQKLGMLSASKAGFYCLLQPTCLGFDRSCPIRFAHFSTNILLFKEGPARFRDHTINK